MATLDEIRAAEAELLSTLASLRTRVEQQNQAIVDLIARGNITPAEAEAINQRAAQTNQQIAAAQPLLRRTLDLVNEGAGFLNRPAVNEIGTRIRDTVSSFSALAGQAGANRQEMNRLVSADQAATKNAVDAKAAEDQGPNTESSGQVAVATGVATQAPALGATQINDDGAIVATSTTAIPTNAFDPESQQPVPISAPPSLPGTSSATSITPPGGPVSPGATQNALTPAPGQSEASQSYVYKATVVTSVFERGRFTQDIEGVLLIFSDPAVIKSGSSVASVTGSTATQADVRRVDNASDASRLPDQNLNELRKLQRQSGSAGSTVLATQADVRRIDNALAAENLAQQAQSSVPSTVTGTGLVDPRELAPGRINTPTSSGLNIGIPEATVGGSPAPQQNIAREP
jgi:hypothetical protein